MKSRLNMFQHPVILLVVERGAWAGFLLAVMISACSPAAGKPLASESLPPTQPPLASTVSTQVPVTSATMPAPIVKKTIGAVAITAAATMTQATEVTTALPAAPAAAGVSFASQVFPLLQTSCQSCHGGQKTAKGLSMNTYANLMKGAEDGLVIVPGDANNSYLVKLISNGKMPNRGKKLSANEIQLIIDWINAGALNN